MVVLRGEDSKWYSCPVLYIGSAAPTESFQGLDAVQEPLNKRYPSDLSSVEAIDADLTVLPDTLLVRYKESGHVFEYPIAKLKTCCAVRAVNVVDASTGEHKRKFVPVNQIECDKEHPAVFSVVIRRVQGRQIQECHSFICHSPRDALHLVNATATANLALKKGGQTVGDRTIVVQQNGYQSDGSRGYSQVNRGPAQQPDNDIIYVRSSAEEVSPRIEPQPVDQHVIHVGSKREVDMEPLSYTIRQPEGNKCDSDDVIYVTFDKSNLIKTDEDKLRIKTGSYDDHVVSYTDRPPSPLPPQMIVERPRYSPRPLPPAPMVMPARPRMMLGPPMPPPGMGPPMPPPGMILRPPPPRMYERRFMSPPPRFVGPPPRAYVRSRAKSASPNRYAASETKVTRVPTGRYHSRWRSHASDIAPPPKSYMTRYQQSNSPDLRGGPMMPRSVMGYYGHPSSFGALYDRPVTKSNPRYSSSESDSSDHADNRFDRSKR